MQRLLATASVFDLSGPPLGNSSLSISLVRKRPPVPLWWRGSSGSRPSSGRGEATQKLLDGMLGTVDGSAGVVLEAT